MRINKEKAGMTTRFSIRLPRYQHAWVSSISNKTRGTTDFESMNTIIKKAIDLYMENYGG